MWRIKTFFSDLILKIQVIIESIQKHEFLERKYYDFINEWGDVIANEVSKILNSYKEENCIVLFSKLSWLYYKTPKFNFLNKDKLLYYFMDDYFGTDDKEYVRIKGFYEYICYTLCGKKKNVNYYWEAIQDLIGFERTGEKFEFQKYF